MPRISTLPCCGVVDIEAEHVVQRIAADRAPVHEPGAVGIRPEPAAAIARHCGGQSRRAPGRGRMWRVGESAEAGRLVWAELNFFVNGGGSRQAAVSGCAGSR
jgi:hypothetical protein